MGATLPKYTERHPHYRHHPPHQRTRQTRKRDCVNPGTRSVSRIRFDPSLGSPEDVWQHGCGGSLWARKSCHPFQPALPQPSTRASHTGAGRSRRMKIAVAATYATTPRPISSKSQPSGPSSVHRPRSSTNRICQAWPGVLTARLTNRSGS